VDAWRKALYCDFERALDETRLPERPNYKKANEFLINGPKETSAMSFVHSTINHQLAQRQRPDYETANRFLIKAWRERANHE
jgi:hypothetical protein